MTIRKTARWQQSVDDRILEYLRDETWSTPEYLADVPGIHANEDTVAKRCRILAEVNLLEYVIEDMKLVELTTRGEQYLEGKVDVELLPEPETNNAIEG